MTIAEQRKKTAAAILALIRASMRSDPISVFDTYGVTAAILFGNPRIALTGWPWFEWSPIVGAVSDLAESRARCACRAAVSIAQDLPLVLVVGRRNNIANDLEGVLHRSDPGSAFFD